MDDKNELCNIKTEAGEDSYEDDLFVNECGYLFNKCDNNSRVEYKLYPFQDAMSFRVIYPGVNLHCYCENKECKSHKNGSGWVWVKLGFGLFRIGEIRGKLKCCACDQKLKPRNVKNIGFTQALVEFEGSRLDDQDDEEPFNQQDEETKGKLVTFKEYEGSQCRWAYLNVDAKRVAKKE